MPGILPICLQDFLHGRQPGLRKGIIELCAEAPCMRRELFSCIRRADRNLLIHRMHLDDNYVVLDVNSGAVHIIDAMIYDLLGFYDG